jgi:hypothetical protein
MIAIGIAKAIFAGGAPAAEVAPPAVPHAVQAAGVWIVLRAFAAGCTAMTGVETVANAVPAFRDPKPQHARRTLVQIVAILIVLLLGVSYLCSAFHVTATPPGQPGYQTVLSMLAGAVFGRGLVYEVAIGAILCVLALSANTSFGGFPRLCQRLAHDSYLPRVFAERGRRLVYSSGIIVLAVLSGVLIVAFGGVTDRLIPLFAIGAFVAFTLSQAGMVRHWQRTGGPHARRSMIINATGAALTGATAVIAAASKFTEGAWLVIIMLPALVWMLVAIGRHYRRLAQRVTLEGPVEIPPADPPIAIVAIGSWNRVTAHGLRFALRLAREVYVVQVATEDADTAALERTLEAQIMAPARAAGIAEPRLVILRSPFRQFYDPIVDFVAQTARAHPGRDIAVVVPDLVTGHWYERLLHENRGPVLRARLRAHESGRVVVIDTPFHLR